MDKLTNNQINPEIELMDNPSIITINMYSYEHNSAAAPCTKQQTKHVLLRVHIKKSTEYIRTYMACGVRVVLLEHGA